MSWLANLSNLVRVNEQNYCNSAEKRENIEMITLRDQPLIVFDGKDEVIASPNKRAKPDRLKASASDDSKANLIRGQLFTPPKQKPQPLNFDNFRVFMDHKYDHERTTPSPVKNRFPGKLTPKHGVALMREELGFDDIKELGVGCYGTAYSVKVKAADGVKGQEEVAVCKTYVFGRDYDFQKKSGIFGE